MLTALSRLLPMLVASEMAEATNMSNWKIAQNMPEEWPLSFRSLTRAACVSVQLGHDILAALTLEMAEVYCAA